jgi:hypothetical protein
MNWRKSISSYALVIALLLSTLGAAFAAPTKGTEPPPPLTKPVCGPSGVSGSTGNCLPPPPSKPIIVAPTPPGGWQVK